MAGQVRSLSFSEGVSVGTPTQVDVAGNVNTSYTIQNLGLSLSVGSNALTIALKQSDGSTDATSTAPVKIAFRSSTLTSGAYATRSVTASLSLVISSGSTLGHTSGNAHYIYVYAIDNSGTVVLGVSSSIFDEGTLVSSTAEGGSGGADTSSTMYTSSAVTSKACRLIARMLSTQTTAGTWAAVPTYVSLFPFELPLISAVYQTNAGQSIPDNTFTVIDFEDKIYDPYKIVTFGATWKATAIKSGYYLVSVYAQLAASTAWNEGEAAMGQVYKNGSIYAKVGYQTGQTAAVGGYTMTVNGSCLVYLAATEYLDFQIYQNTGGPLALNNTATNNTISISYIGA